ncbi:MAG: multiprotein bridging factor aMBF1 [Candidatus Thorarchaeota archaeon]
MYQLIPTSSQLLLSTYPILKDLKRDNNVPSCELCGRNMKGRGRNVEIEGARMNVCPQCASRFGGSESVSGHRDSSAPKMKPSWVGESRKPAPMTPHRPPSFPKRRPKPRSSGTLLDDMMLVEDFARRIQIARQKKKLNQEELAQKVGERISTLQAIEAGRLKPTRKTIRGLERELDISLLEPIDAVPIKTSRGSSGTGPTLGDRVVVKRKKSQKSE